jgi:uncharacterized RDD family membrane protein YckC
MYGLGSTELIIILILFLGIIPFVLWLWALIDILRNEFTGDNKIIWLLVVILVPFVGFILYFFIGRDQKVKAI